MRVRFQFLVALAMVLGVTLGITTLQGVARADGPVSTEEGAKMTPEERAAHGFGQWPSPERIAQAAAECAADARLQKQQAEFEAWVANRGPILEASSEGVAPLAISGTMFVPLIRQATSYYCGPASTLMALRYMGAAGDLSSNNTTAQNQLWAEVGVSPSAGSDSTLIQLALNRRQTRYSYNGGYQNMNGCDVACFRYKWEFTFAHSAPGIPNVDTNHLYTYGGYKYYHYMTQRGFNWTTDKVTYNDPNSIRHYGIWQDSAGDMHTAITHRDSGLKCYVG